MKCVYIDAINRKVEVRDHSAELSDFYNDIDCRCIDIVHRKIGNGVYSIVCDDEGWLKDEVLPSAINQFNNVMFVGNILIFSGITELEPLDDKMSEEVCNNILNIQGHPVLLCEY